MKKIKEYLKNANNVSHITFNPKGPGVIRIHLVPPKKLKLGVSWVIIINGPSATFGSEFSIVRYGSNIFAIIGKE